MVIQQALFLKVTILTPKFILSTVLAWITQNRVKSALLYFITFFSMLDGTILLLLNQVQLLLETSLAKFISWEFQTALLLLLDFSDHVWYSLPTTCTGHCNKSLPQLSLLLVATWPTPRGWGSWTAARPWGRGSSAGSSTDSNILVWKKLMFNLGGY